VGPRARAQVENAPKVQKLPICFQKLPQIARKFYRTNARMHQQIKWEGWSSACTRGPCRLQMAHYGPPRSATGPPRSQRAEALCKISAEALESQLRARLTITEQLAICLTAYDEPGESQAVSRSLTAGHARHACARGRGGGGGGGGGGG
jgi:hypothetical protein